MNKLSGGKPVPLQGQVKVATDDSDASRLIDAIYDAPLVASAWGQIVDLLEARFRGQVAFFVQRHQPVSAIAGCTSLDAAAIAAYLESFSAHDLGIRQLQSAPAGAIVLDSSLIDDAGRARSPFYGDFLSHIGAQRGFYATLFRQGDESVVVGIHRPSKLGDYNDDDAAWLGRLLPHFQRSLRVRSHLEETLVAANASTKALESTGVGLLIADARARLRFANAIGEEHLRGRGLTLTGGRIHALDRRATDGLHRAIAHAARLHGAAATTIMLPRSGYGGSLTVAVTPMRPEFSSEPKLAEPLAMIVVGRSDAPQLDDDRLRQAYDLTPTEMRLLCALVAGERVNEFAERNNVQVSTVKTHLNNLFSKVGEQRQADLVRRVLSDPALWRTAVDSP